MNPLSRGSDKAHLAVRIVATPYPLENIDVRNSVINGRRFTVVQKSEENSTRLLRTGVLSSLLVSAPNVLLLQENIGLSRPSLENPNVKVSAQKGGCIANRSPDFLGQLS